MTEDEQIAAHRRFTSGFVAGKWVIHYQPRPRQTDHGLDYLPRWVALELTGTVADAPVVAQTLCDLLNANWPEAEVMA